MDQQRAAHLARTLMDEYGLRRWTFGFDNAKRRCGNCNFGKMRITLSRYYVSLNKEADILDTIRHEIAHAIAGFTAGHGPHWREAARQVGARPQRCADASVSMPKAKYRLMCERGHDLGTRHRRSRAMAHHICGRCHTGLRYVLNT